MGREGNSRGTTQVSRTRRLRLAGRFVPTNISLPCNAGIAVRTTWAQYIAPLLSHERLERELQLVSGECNFQQLRCISLAVSASLLSSVFAFI